MNNLPKNIGPAKFLSKEEIKIVDDTHMKNVILAGYYDYIGEFLTFFKEDGAPLHVPMSFFKATNVSPDPEKLEIIDCGLTIKLGEYEADVGTIIEKFDK